MKMRVFAALAAACFVYMAAPAQALIIGAPAGGPTESNCYPFGCAFNWPPEYQQVYNKALFPGPMTIGSLRFYNNVQDVGFENNPADLNSGTFQISLSTTSAAVNGLNTSNLSLNIGPDNTLVFSGSIPASVAAGGFFDIFFTTPFSYNPAAGNLLIDVFSNNVSHGPVLDAYLDAHFNTFGNDSSRAMSGGSNFTSTGLVTGFNEGQTQAVPEPGTLSLLGLGLFGAGAMRRRKASAKNS
jgi:hypothetical protein